MNNISVDKKRCLISSLVHAGYKHFDILAAPSVSNHTLEMIKTSWVKEVRNIVNKELGGN